MAREPAAGMGKGFWVAAIVLLAALMGSIGVVGYLLGKQAKPEPTGAAPGPVMAPSGEPTAPEKPAPAEKPVSEPAAAAPPEGLRIVDGPDGIVITDGNREGTIVRKGNQILLLLHQEKGPPPAAPPPAAPPAAAPAAPATPKKTGASEADAVREYFLLLATLQRGPVGVGPQQFAERLTGNLAQGNTADFDELVSDAEKAYDEVRKLSAPEPCREVHRLTLGVMKDGVDVLRDLRDAVVQRNVSELQRLEGRARELMSRVKDLDRQQAALREKFGIY